jgi:hypothetical protein
MTKETEETKTQKKKTQKRTKHRKRERKRETTQRMLKNDSFRTQTHRKGYSRVSMT